MGKCILNSAKLGRTREIIQYGIIVARPFTESCRGFNLNCQHCETVKLLKIYRKYQIMQYATYYKAFHVIVYNRVLSHGNRFELTERNK